MSYMLWSLCLKYQKIEKNCNYPSTAQLFTTVRLHSVTDLSGKKPNVASRHKYYAILIVIPNDVPIM